MTSVALPGTSSATVASTFDAYIPGVNKIYYSLGKKAVVSLEFTDNDQAQAAMKSVKAAMGLFNFQNLQQTANPEGVKNFSSNVISYCVFEKDPENTLEMDAEQILNRLGSILEVRTNTVFSLIRVQELPLSEAAPNFRLPSKRLFQSVVKKMIQEEKKNVLPQSTQISSQVESKEDLEDVFLDARTFDALREITEMEDLLKPASS
ncbi:MAG: hypothetical protein V4487_06800 [Chlamydiota bacterium]